jgi:hypothetical protein
MSAADPNVYMSDSEDDGDFVATAADLEAAAEAANMHEEHNSDDEAADCSSDSSQGGHEEVGLALSRDMLPTTAIPCLNTKTSWGREAATIAARKCKLSVAHCPANGKVAVLPIEDLLPTSGGIPLDIDGLWATATRGSAVERYLLVAMELNDGPENAQWRLWQLPMATDQRLVREIVATSGVEFTDDLKKKLIAASDPANRTLAGLPPAVAAAFETYGGLVYSSATYQKMKPRTAAAPAKIPPKSLPKAADKPPQAASKKPSAAPEKTQEKEPTKKRKPAPEACDAAPTPAPVPKRPKPAPVAVETTLAAPAAPAAPVGSQTFTLTITTSNPAAIARVLEAAQKSA